MERHVLVYHPGVFSSDVQVTSVAIQRKPFTFHQLTSRYSNIFQNYFEKLIANKEIFDLLPIGGKRGPQIYKQFGHFEIVNIRY